MPTYRVSVKTADVGDAGTDSDIWITLYGSNGQTIREELTHNNWIATNPPNFFGGIDNFERNRMDIFDLQQQADLGALQKIVVESDDTGNKPGWALEYVVVSKHPTDIAVKFVPPQSHFVWLGGGSEVTRELFPVN